MPKLIINISVKLKIMIKSPEVCLGFRVGHRNINIFIYKNHLSRFCINVK
jgi:hypothetical protein